MEKTDCIQIGRILKTFGYKGEYVVQLSEEFVDIVLSEGSVFIENDEELVPYFIEYFEHGEEDLHRMKFEDITDVDQAKMFNGQMIWFPFSRLPQELAESNPLRDIKGFVVIDVSKGETGIAEEIIELPHQSVLRILHGNKEILLPVNKRFILKTDRKKRQILISAPEGLIDSYLE